MNKPNGRVYNSKNLSLFAYSTQNSVKFVDPTGFVLNEKVKHKIKGGKYYPGREGPEGSVDFTEQYDKSGNVGTFHTHRSKATFSIGFGADSGNMASSKVIKDAGRFHFNQFSKNKSSCSKC